VRIDPIASGYRLDCSFRALATELADTFSLKTSRPKLVQLGLVPLTKLNTK
jgi:hypothetical protein